MNDSESGIIWDREGSGLNYLLTSYSDDQSLQVDLKLRDLVVVE